MQPEVMFALTPIMNSVFPSACRQVLGYSPLTAADAVSREMSEAERFLSCVAAVRNQKAAPGFVSSLLSHVSYSIFLVADECDIRDILSCCSGMSFVTTETLARSVLAAVITGTLAQWRDAVAAGSTREIVASVRFAFNKVYGLFRSANLNIWNDYQSREAPDHQTLLLEYKPR